MPQEDYFSLLHYSSLLIGNTSSGLIEAPSINLPFVYLGIRQKSREQAGNVIEVLELTEASLISAMELALYDIQFLKKMKSTKNPYEGKAPSKEIASIICEELSNKGKKKLLDKKI